jgi:hypothetical protein
MHEVELKVEASRLRELVLSLVCLHRTGLIVSLHGRHGDRALFPLTAECLPHAFDVVERRRGGETLELLHHRDGGVFVSRAVDNCIALCRKDRRPKVLREFAARADLAARQRAFIVEEGLRHDVGHGLVVSRAFHLTSWVRPSLHGSTVRQ